MKTSELTGAQLDHWVARANGWTFGPPHKTLDCEIWRDVDGKFVGCAPASGYKPSTDWSYGGPIIEREKIDLRHRHDRAGAMKGVVFAWPKYQGREVFGPAPLVAAMRAYVASKFGDEVPDA